MPEIEHVKASMLNRFWQYQAERFPFLSHGILVASFSFSAVSYSRICRGAEGFISLRDFAAGAFTTISIFLLVRIFDEHKDAEEDALHRSHLPVPRGLVSLTELRNIGLLTVVLQLIVQLVFFPRMLPLFLAVMLYLCLMGKEFFIAAWLKKHQFWYVVSHMMIIPLIDIYASGLDWLLGKAEAPDGLAFFFLVSFMNGVVLEIGRKIRMPEDEEFNTYSAMMGAPRAARLWILMLFITLCSALAAALFAGYGLTGFAVLTTLFALCASSGFMFLVNPSRKKAKLIEYASGIWTIGMYLSLGGIPMLRQIII